METSLEGAKGGIDKENGQYFVEYLYFTMYDPP